MLDLTSADPLLGVLFCSRSNRKTSAEFLHWHRLTQGITPPRTLFTLNTPSYTLYSVILSSHRCYLKLKRLPVLLWTKKLTRGIRALIKCENALNGTAGLQWNSYIKSWRLKLGPAAVCCPVGGFPSVDFIPHKKLWKGTVAKCVIWFI